MPNEGQQTRTVRDRSISRAVLATTREMFLARVLLHIVDQLGKDEAVHFEGFTYDVYGQLKSLAEGKLRDGEITTPKG